MHLYIPRCETDKSVPYEMCDRRSSVRMMAPVRVTIRTDGGRKKSYNYASLKRVRTFASSEYSGFASISRILTS